MLELENIPMWMEEYITTMTDGQCKNKEDVEKMCENLQSWQMGIIVNLNIQIGLLNKLDNLGKLN